jgi:hypothetical protein
MRPLDIFAHIHQKPRNMRMYPDIVDNIPKTLHIFLKYVGDKQTPVSSTEQGSSCCVVNQDVLYNKQVPQLLVRTGLQILCRITKQRSNTQI